jgi:glycerophosphoryl diester phosphodiesterase
MKIIAHRGNHDAGFAPENTLEAVKHAWDLNVDGVEIDVHMTKDRRIAVIHDFWTGKLTDSSLSVGESTLKELKELSVTGRKKNHPLYKFRIPSLEEVLITVPPGKTLFIEIKHDSDPSGEIISILNHLFDQYHISSRQIIFIGFVENQVEFEKMKKIKKVFTDYRVFPIFNLEKAKIPDEIIEKALAMGADGVDIGSGALKTFKDLTKKYTPLENFIQKFTKRNLSVNLWSLDDPNVAKTFIDAGVSSITTNKPKLIMECL